MPTLLQLTDGTTMIDLNTGSISSGITLETIRLPEVQRQVARVTSFPFVDGGRTMASTLEDTRVEIICHIRGTNADNVEAQYLALTRLLEQAQRWEVSRTGSPVRLAWKRNGVTNTAYWVVTGATPPRLAGDAEWLPAETNANMLRLRLQLLLEPVAHAGALTSVITTQSITNTPGANYKTTTTPSGSMEGPVTVVIEPASVVWSHCWIAQLSSAPEVQNRIGTVDAAAYGGSAETVTATGTPTNIGGSALGLLDTALPLRLFVRLKVTGGTANKLQVRTRTGAGLYSLPIYSGWSSFAGISGSYLLHDAGSISPIPDLQNRAHMSSEDPGVSVELRTSDASTVTVLVDYLEVMSYSGLVKLTNLDLTPGGDVIYEDIQKSATFHWPRRTPIAYQTQPDGTLSRNALRYGRLGRLRPGATSVFWVNGQAESAHLLADGSNLSASHLPGYALGLRGAG